MYFSWCLHKLPPWLSPKMIALPLEATLRAAIDFCGIHLHLIAVRLAAGLAAHHGCIAASSVRDRAICRYVWRCDKPFKYLARASGRRWSLQVRGQQLDGQRSALGQVECLRWVDKLARKINYPHPVTLIVSHKMGFCASVLLSLKPPKGILCALAKQCKSQKMPSLCRELCYPRSFKIGNRNGSWLEIMPRQRNKNIAAKGVQDMGKITPLFMGKMLGCASKKISRGRDIRKSNKKADDDVAFSSIMSQDIEHMDTPRKIPNYIHCFYCRGINSYKVKEKADFLHQIFYYARHPVLPN